MTVVGVPGTIERSLKQRDGLSLEVRSKVLQIIRAGTLRSVGSTQTLEQVVRRAILLND
jgi:hypothetical protein